MRWLVVMPWLNVHSPREDWALGEANRCRGGGGRPPDPPSLCAADGGSQGRLRARSAPSRICDSGSDAGLYRGINRSRGWKTVAVARKAKP